MYFSCRTVGIHGHNGQAVLRCSTPSRWRAFEQACSQFLPAAPTLWRVVEHTHVLCHNPDPIPVTTARNPPKPHFGQSGHPVYMDFRDRLQAVAIMYFHFPLSIFNFQLFPPTPTLWIVVEYSHIQQTTFWTIWTPCLHGF